MVYTIISKGSMYNMYKVIIEKKHRNQNFHRGHQTRKTTNNYRNKAYSLICGTAEHPKATCAPLPFSPPLPVNSLSNKILLFSLPRQITINKRKIFPQNSILYTQARYRIRGAGKVETLKAKHRKKTTA